MQKVQKLDVYGEVHQEIFRYFSNLEKVDEKVVWEYISESMESGIISISDCKKFEEAFIDSEELKEWKIKNVHEKNRIYELDKRILNLVQAEIENGNEVKARVFAKKLKLSLNKQKAQELIENN